MVQWQIVRRGIGSLPNMIVESIEFVLLSVEDDAFWLNIE